MGHGFEIGSQDVGYTCDFDTWRWLFSTEF